MVGFDPAIHALLRFPHVADSERSVTRALAPGLSELIVGRSRVTVGFIRVTN